MLILIKIGIILIITALIIAVIIRYILHIIHFKSFLQEQKDLNYKMLDAFLNDFNSNDNSSVSEERSD